MFNIKSPFSGVRLSLSPVVKDASLRGAFFTTTVSVADSVIVELLAITGDPVPVFSILS